MNLVKLTGVMNNSFSTDEILKRAVDAGALRATVISREIGVEAPEDKVDNVKKTLGRLNITEIRVKEHTKIETTVMRSAQGDDPQKLVKVSLSPGARLTGLRPVSVIITQDVKKRLGKRADSLNKECSAIVKETLMNASVSDALFSIRIKKASDDYTTALKLATTDAIESAEGITQIN